jgi:hypothetical protein
VKDLENSRKRGKLAVARFAVDETALLLSAVWIERRLKRQQRGAYLGGLLLQEGSLPLNPCEGGKRLQLLLRQMEYAIAHHDFARARPYAFAEQRYRLPLSGGGNG